MENISRHYDEQENKLHRAVTELDSIYMKFKDRQIQISGSWARWGKCTCPSFCKVQLKVLWTETNLGRLKKGRKKTG